MLFRSAIDAQPMTPFTSRVVVITGNWEKPLTDISVAASSNVASGFTESGGLFAAANLLIRCVGSIYGAALEIAPWAMTGFD